MPDVSAQQRQVLLTTAQAGALLELSAERIRQLIGAGYIEKHGKDQVPLVSAVRGYIRFLKDDERKASRTAAVSRVQIARAREIEFKIAEREHRLIDIAEHEDLFAEAFGSIRSGLAGVPARVTRDVELRRRIEAGIDDVLRRAADRFEEGTANLKASGADIAPDDGDDA
ncbi:MAG: hypothetical protein K2X62_10540 [Beijerinckiaceae bacterium]|nr:hypothetical protein [Beijerinckiaceae bacterium]